MEHTPKLTPEFERTVIEVRDRLAVKYGEDVAQEVAARMLEQASRGRPIAERGAADVTPYMYWSARNASIDETRRRWRQVPLAPSGWYTDPADPSGSAERWWTGTRWTDETRSLSGRPQVAGLSVGRLPKQRMASEVLDVGIDGSAAAAVGAGSDPAEMVDRKMAVERILAALRPLDAQVLRLVFLGGLDDAEVARLIGKTVRGAQSIKVRAIARAARIAPFLFDD